MKRLQWLLVALTVINVGCFVFGTVMTRPAAADSVTPIVRTRLLQLVDEQGRVRASIAVLPASQLKDGRTYPETVLLRLITEQGRPSVKISASEQASGLTLVGPSGTRDTYVTLESKGKESTLRLRNEDGREQVLKPDSK